MTQPCDVAFASRQYQDWLAALKDRASLATDNPAPAMVREVMHYLRRSLPPDDVVVAADALPALPRVIFIEGWSSTRRGGPSLAGGICRLGRRRPYSSPHAAPDDRRGRFLRVDAVPRQTRIRDHRGPSRGCAEIVVALIGPARLLSGPG